MLAFSPRFLTIRKTSLSFILLVLSVTILILYTTPYQEQSSSLRLLWPRKHYLNQFDKAWFDNYKNGYLNKRENIFEELKNIRQNSSNIFFIESSCGKEVKEGDYDSEHLNLNPRQVCAIESTARTNPDRHVYILYTCPLSEDFIYHKPLFSRKLFGFENVHIVKLNLGTIFNATPLKRVYKNKLHVASTFPVENLSDLLRLIVVWKYGGTYLDLDVITMRSLKDLGTNYVGRESSTHVNGAVLNAKPYGSGHDFIYSVLQFVSEHYYNGFQWGGNGPMALTKVILKACKLEVLDDTIHDCKAFHVLRPEVFYPVPWENESSLFYYNSEQSVQRIKNSSYIVHFWNYKSNKHVVNISSSQAYALLAAEFCPTVIEHVDTF